MQPLISIILPVYGVEEYLEECIQSMVNQTYQNIEIILVDDGSKDRCPQIIDEWAEKDSRIVAIHKENGGQSSARNYGLDIAKGEYITFIDSDDFVSRDYCDELYHTAQLYDADIVVGSFSKVKGKIEFAASFFKNESRYYSCEPQIAIKYFIEQFIAVWGKLYKAEILKDVRFPQGRLAEEYAFQIQALVKSKTVGFCNKHLYKYRIRANSDAHSIKPKYLLDNIQAVDEAYEMCLQYFPDEAEYCRKHLADLIYEFIAAEKYGKEVVLTRQNVIDHALITVGGKENLLNLIEEPLEILFYTYSQFYPYLSRTEKKKIQLDYRKIFSWKQAKTNLKKFITKYFLCAISLELAVKIS